MRRCPPTSATNLYLHQVSPFLDSALNSLIQQEAADPQIGATYIDLTGLFVGHENEYTLADQTISTAYGDIPNDHPTTLGYSVIAQQLAAKSAAAVPEPSNITLIGLGLPVAIVSALRSQQHRGRR